MHFSLCKERYQLLEEFLGFSRWLGEEHSLRGYPRDPERLKRGSVMIAKRAHGIQYLDVCIGRSMLGKPDQYRAREPSPCFFSPMPTKISPPDVFANAEIVSDSFEGLISTAFRSR